MAIDVMGGDYGESVVVAGVIEAKRRSGDLFSPILCGDRTRICSQFRDLRRGDREVADAIEIEHCSEVITSSDLPSRTWKEKSNSSIVRCVSLQKEGRVDASLSAGHTGVLMGAAVFILGCLEGISRPALAAFLPTTKKTPTLLLDVGANLNCRTQHLVSFGMLGYAYYRNYFPEEEKPRLALLNIGKEPRKGTAAITEAGKILARKCDGYIGFVEGSDVLSGGAEVIVCDGFSGNVLLKACESFHALIETALEGHRSVFDLIKGRMAILNSENYGAVPLLGIKGMVMKAHGASSPKAIANALQTAIELGGRTSSPPLPLAHLRKGSDSLVS